MLNRVRFVVLLLVAGGIALARYPLSTDDTHDATMPFSVVLQTSKSTDELVSPVDPSGLTDDEVELHYDGDFWRGSTVNQYPLTWAVRVTPVEDYTLVAIRYYQPDSTPYPVTQIRVYDAGSTSVPGALVRSQDYTPASVGWHRVNLASQFPVTAGRDFWASVHMDRYPPTPAIGVDQGPIIPSRNYCYVPGYGWMKLESISGQWNLNLRAVVLTGGTGVEEPVAADELVACPVASPARSSARFSYQLAKPGRVALVVYDAAGAEVVRLVDANLAAGKHGLTWDLRGSDGRRVQLGTYLHRLTANSQTVAGKVVVLD